MVWGAYSFSSSGSLPYGKRRDVALSKHLLWPGLC